MQSNFESDEEADPYLAAVKKHHGAGTQRVGGVCLHWELTQPLQQRAKQPNEATITITTTTAAMALTRTAKRKASASASVDQFVRNLVSAI